MHGEHEIVGLDCAPVFQDEGVSCDDGNATTSNDKCLANGICEGTPYSCPQKDCQTAPVQDGEGVCMNRLLRAHLATMNGATGNDSCLNGIVFGVPIVCPGAPCLEDGQPNGEGCDYTFSPSGTPCNDLSVDTINDQCNGSGTCSGTPFSCPVSVRRHGNA